MTGLVRKAAVLAACGVIFGAAVAFAGVPSPGNSDTPLRINLGGTNSGTLLADATSPGALVTVTVRDLGNNPIANSSVVFDFSGNVSDTRIGDTQVYPGTLANCGTHGVSALTDAFGVATFAVQGAGLTVVGAPHAGGSGKIYADGVLLGTVNVGLYDLDGGGVGGLDLGRLGSDILSGGNYDRVDYNNDGAGDGLDLSIWGAVYFAASSDANSATFCP